MQIEITRHQEILHRLAEEKDETIGRATKWALDESLRALQQQDEIDRLRAELAAAIEQRDEARREVCRHLSMRSACLGVHRSSKEHAIERGWDCYAEKEGGGA